MPNERDLHPILAGVLVVIAALCTIAAILIGLAPGAWDRFGGVAVAFGVSYAWLRPVIDVYLTEAQGWIAFALFGTVMVGFAVVHAALEGTQVSGRLLAAFAVCLALSALFWYRATASA